MPQYIEFVNLISLLWFPPPGKLQKDEGGSDEEANMEEEGIFDYEFGGDEDYEQHESVKDMKVLDEITEDMEDEGVIQVNNDNKNSLLTAIRVRTQ